MIFLLFLFALLGLWLGSELIIRSALAISKKINVSEVFIGLTILAIGTDLPELFISLSAGYQRLLGQNTSEIVIANAVGSVFSQLALVLGIIGLIKSIKLQKKQIIRDGVFMILGICLLIFLGYDGVLSKLDALVLLFVYGYYIIELFREEKRSQIIESSKLDGFWALISLFGGLALLLYSSELTLEIGLKMSEDFGIAQTSIGILLVGLGTSLPELATTITAVRKGAGRLALGNILGSNIYDLLFMVGAGTLISPLHFDFSLIKFDLFLLLAVSIYFLFALTSKLKFEKKEAIILIIIYIFYYLFRLFLI